MRASFWTRLFDLAAPRACPVCGRRLSTTERVVCLDCLLDMPLTHYEQTSLDNEMAQRFWGLFPVERVAAYCFYTPQSSVARLIYDLKYHARPDIGRHMGFIMARQMDGVGFFEGIDAMVPMPLSRWRQWNRGYNQSEQIALGISEATGIPVLSKVVRRKHFIVSQTHLNRWERQANTADAFALLQPDRIRGCHLLLVDDIVTTGATLTALATELQQAGDVRISIVSFGYSKSL